jgi:hypothetical protein
LVNQIPSLIEALTGFEKNNKYVVRNAAQQQIFFAAEGKHFKSNLIIEMNFIIEMISSCKETDICMRLLY